ncbi:Fungal Zn(2)-Cys(6) binuclear cluster domain-containing protein [Penicillium ucsense]|uniref:Fungal Zn(2)-Cys(6) binuclear cluster domain-containing protein n=1 Tax=Penicillium ucsense TaxID=2839758 RepID=A0A8J8VXZ1_9EURO|nr:Fungal Zn(2)-Cys(6) binuclear cluster domain-containing protein [Penicillium ucsense]KAF7733318.1 Fungal Zn(2)-Cys(6) binuclear cluster domain-containing protein [Penicillium ucsense]
MSTRTAKSRSRQKSCTICAEGKRRCNRQTPQCSRCSERGLKCTYLNSPRMKTRPSTVDSASPLSHIRSDVDTDFEISFALLSSHPDMWTDSSTLAASRHLDRSSSLTTMPNFCPAIFFPEIVRPDQWSIEQLLGNINSFPELFARSGATPFLHPQLYESDMPTAMQDAFAVTAAYFSRTPETEALTLRVLEKKSKSLMKQVQNTSSLRELLASVQALLIFQIIQLFQGTSRQRSLAEQDMEMLRSLTTRLQIQGEDLVNPITWQDWIFLESIRRTVIISVLLDSLYWSLKFGHCTQAKILSMLPVTPVSELWECPTSTDWPGSIPTRSKTILYGDFSMAWKEGRVTGKLDDFQKFLLVPCVGAKYKDLLAD